MIAQARVVGWRAWLSLYSSTTTLATQGGVLLVAADPLGQLGLRPFTRWEGVRVEGRKHRVKAGGGRLAGALVGGVDGPLADGLGVAGGHAEAVAGEGFAQRRPGGVQLLGGGVDAAELFGELEGALGFGPVGQEAAGLPAHPLLGLQGPMVAAGDGSTSVRRWVDRLQPVSQTLSSGCDLPAHRELTQCFPRPVS
jgi:hypothetical protein